MNELFLCLLYVSPLFFFVLPYAIPSFWWAWKKGEGGGPLGRHGSLWVAAGDADRGRTRDNHVKHHSLPLGSSSAVAIFRCHAHDPTVCGYPSQRKHPNQPISQQACCRAVVFSGHSSRYKEHTVYVAANSSILHPSCRWNHWRRRPEQLHACMDATLVVCS